MAYFELDIPASTPSEIRSIIRDSFDLYFADVHAMLRLPLPIANIYSGCNFPVALTLFAALSAASRMLFPCAGPDGDAFVQLVAAWFPWESEPTGALQGENAARILYDDFRNPLVHSAGLAMRPRGGGENRHYIFYTPTGHRVVQKKEGLPEDELEQIERSKTRPASWGPTLVRENNDGVSITGFLLEGLYWGCRRMISNLCADTTVMGAARAALARAREAQRESDFPMSQNRADE